MNHLKHRLAYLIARMDALVLAGLALAVGALLMQIVATASTRASVQQLKQQAAAAKAEAVHSAGLRERGDAPPLAAQFDEFYRNFPSRQSAPDLLQKVYAAAANHGIQLSQGEYRMSPDKGGKLVGYQINLPVKGKYAQLRKFAVQVLSDVPAASLDELTFKRDTVASAEVDARIRLTIYLRSGE
jgi:Tfp pilus assembly protein PilO